MKKAILLLLIALLWGIQIQAQINANPSPNGPVWITGDCLPTADRLFEDIPVLHLSDTSMNTQLPRIASLRHSDIITYRMMMIYRSYITTLPSVLLIQAPHREAILTSLLTTGGLISRIQHICIRIR